ncbi:LuxR family transcriptional regulator [Sphingomonas populi]|uniref:LuxR family transcriptional regulator n=1 Tax=Sphingomonas populi TaxID=2484750 RepID=A0A4Q6XVB1_9SPHN|nr:helix-turn-helix transcriptional regulator [Sphingomonas populi]RZF63905.1 LuxR family transcriptional regulator [Sphingomonas populi]
MPNLFKQLTPRQIQCLALVAKGMTSKEVARELSLSARTVDDHVERARIKLGAPTRHRAASLYRERPPEKELGDFPNPVPYQLRREPLQVDECIAVEPIDDSASKLIDGGIVPFGNFPKLAELQLATPKPERNQDSQSSPSSIIMRVLAIAAALAVIVLAYPQLVEGAEVIAAFLRKSTREAGGQ